MATLTLDPKRIPRQDRGRTDRYIRESRQFQGTLPFVAVLEFQENGNAHLHVLLGRYIAQKQLSKAWQRIGGGHHVDIRYVDVHRVSAYVTLYLAGDKVLHTLELLPRRANLHYCPLHSAVGEKEKERLVAAARESRDFLQCGAESFKRAL
jgi:hypothetical protein